MPRATCARARRNYAMRGSYARRATDSNPVYCVPLASSFHIRRVLSIFLHASADASTSAVGRHASRDGKIEERAKTRPRAERSRGLARQNDSRRRLSRNWKSGKRKGPSVPLRGGYFLLRRARFSRVSPRENATVTCFRNDDVSNSALYIPTDVTLLTHVVSVSHRNVSSIVARVRVFYIFHRRKTRNAQLPPRIFCTTGKLQLQLHGGRDLHRRAFTSALLFAILTIPCPLDRVFFDFGKRRRLIHRQKRVY